MQKKVIPSSLVADCKTLWKEAVFQVIKTGLEVRMVLASVTTLSDEEPAPAAGSAKQKPKPKGKPEVTPEPKTESPVAEKTTVKKSQPKTKPAMKRPAAAMTDNGNTAPGSEAPEPVTKKKPAANMNTDSQPPSEPVTNKKPAGKVKQPSWSCNKYIYHRDGVWGVKLQGREVFRVGVSKQNSWFDAVTLILSNLPHIEKISSESVSGEASRVCVA